MQKEKKQHAPEGRAMSDLMRDVDIPPIVTPWKDGRIIMRINDLEYILIVTVCAVIAIMGTWGIWRGMP